MEEATIIIDTINQHVSLGQKRLENNTYLIGKVPHIAQEAWLHAIYPPITMEEINSLPINIPDVYIEFLLQMNGASLFSSALELFGKRFNNKRDVISNWQPFNIITLNNENIAHNESDNQFYFGCYSSDGSILYLDASSKVCRCDRYNFDIKNIWPDFLSFLKAELDRLSEQYDELGKKK